MLNKQQQKQEVVLPHHEYTVRPPVSAISVSSSVHHLWSHILYCPAERVRFIFMIDRLFTESKI